MHCIAGFYIRYFSTPVTGHWDGVLSEVLGTSYLTKTSFKMSGIDVTDSLHEPDPSTKDFFLQQTMLRIKDPKVSLDFYTRVLGMR